MPKNLPIEVTKIEDFIMEDEKFNNLNSWVNHVVEDLGNLAYRKSNGTLVTDRANATNLKLTADRKEVLVEDLGYRFEKNGETSRLIGIENRLIGKYKVVDVISNILYLYTSDIRIYIPSWSNTHMDSAFIFSMALTTSFSNDALISK